MLSKAERFERTVKRAAEKEAAGLRYSWPFEPYEDLLSAALYNIRADIETAKRIAEQRKEARPRCADEQLFDEAFFQVRREKRALVCILERR